VPKTEKKGKHTKMDKATKSSPAHEESSKGGGSKHEPASTGKPDDMQHGSHGHDDSDDSDDSDDTGHKDDKGHGHDDSGDSGHGHESGDKGHGRKR
jgi:hypothetical protein